MCLPLGLLVAVEARATTSGGVSVTVKEIQNFLSEQQYVSQDTWMKCQKYSAAAAAAKSLQSCPTLCDPIDGSPPGSPIPGILQARTLEWVAISFSNA